MTSVWLLTTGEYSDYEVRSVFATEALAEAYKAIAAGGLPDEELCIEERPFFDHVPDPVNVVWSVTITIQSEGPRLGKFETREVEPGRFEPVSTTEYMSPSGLWVHVSGSDRSAVELAAREWGAAHLTAVTP